MGPCEGFISGAGPIQVNSIILVRCYQGFKSKDESRSKKSCDPIPGGVTKSEKIKWKSSTQKVRQRGIFWEGEICKVLRQEAVREAGNRKPPLCGDSVLRPHLPALVELSRSAPQGQDFSNPIL